MERIVIYLLIDVWIVAVFLLGLRWPGRRVLAGVLLAGVVIAVVALKFLFYVHPAVEARIFTWPVYGYARPFILFLPAMLALGLLLPQLGPRLTQRLIPLLFIMMAGLLLRATQSALPPAEGAVVAADIDHHCRQSTAQNCAPAACVSALSYIGVSTDERAMVERCLTSRAGTSDYGIFQGLTLALEGTAFRARMTEPGVDELIHAGMLAVICTDSHTHAVCVMGTGAGVIVQDPLFEGPCVWSREDLADHYSGVASVIEAR